MRFGIIVNPRHRRSDRAESVLVDELNALGARYRTITTSVSWPGGQQARELLDWGADILIVLGGDGTLRAVASEVAGTGVPVLIVPTGSANVLARHLRLNHRGGTMVEVPVNEAEYVTADGRRAREAFVSMAGIGGDAEAVAGQRHVSGIPGYIWGALRALLSPGADMAITPRPSPLDADAGMTVTGRLWSVMAAKVSHPAGPVAVFPRAEATGRLFEFLAVRLDEADAAGAAAGKQSAVGQRLAMWARIAGDGIAGAPERNRSLDCWSGTGLRVVVDGSAPAHLDGDLIGKCRELSVRAGDKRLLLIVPDF